MMIYTEKNQKIFLVLKCLTIAEDMYPIDYDEAMKDVDAHL